MKSIRLFSTPICRKGTRYNQLEDRYDIKSDKNIKFIGVYDGHCGYQVSEALKQSFISSYLVRYLNYAKFKSRADAITAAFLAKDRQFYLNRHLYKDAGSTAVVAIIIPAENSLILANLGDSRAVLFRQNKNSRNIDLQRVTHTVDHKPNRVNEKLRINKAGGFVTKSTIESVPRVDGYLAVSRGFGDLDVKKSRGKDYDPVNGKVCAIPSVTEVKLAPRATYYLVLASDGLWDEINMVELEQYLELYGTNAPMKLMKKVEEKGGDDDITILVYKIET